MRAAAPLPSPGKSAACVLQTFGARPFHTDGGVLALAFAEPGTLWSVEEGGVLRHWNVATQQQTRYHVLDEPALLWALDTKTGLVAAGSDDLQTWEAESGDLVASWANASWISAIAFHPSGAALATGHDDGTVRVWDPARDRPIREFRAHGQPISALAFSPDGKRLATAGEDKTIHLWSLRSGKPLGALIGHTDRIPALAWHPDGKRLISAGWDTTARVWNLTTCEPIVLLNGHSGQVLALALTDDGGQLACADSAHAVHVWSLEDYKILGRFEEYARDIRALAWSPDGRRLAGGGIDRVIRFVLTAAPPMPRETLFPVSPAAREEEWGVRDLALAAPSPQPSPPSTGERGNNVALVAAQSPVGARECEEEVWPIDPQASRTVVVACAGNDRVFSLGAGTELRTWKAAGGEADLQLQGAGALRSLAASPDGRWIAGTRALPGEPDCWHDARRQLDPPADMLGIWEAGTGKQVRFLEGPRPPITTLAFAPDGGQLAAGGFLGEDVWIWQVDSGEPILLIPEAAAGSAIEAVAWHPAGKLLAVSGIDYLATSGTDGTTSVWSVERRHPIAWISGGGVALAFHPQGHHLAIASLVQSVRVWDISATEPVIALELLGHLDAVTCLAYSPDGQLLATGSDDRTVRLWHAHTGAERGHVELDTQVKAVAFAPDGKSLYTGNGNTSCYQLDVGRMLVAAE